MGPKREEEKIQFYNEQLIAIINRLKNDMCNFRILNDSKREDFFNSFQELEHISKEAELFIQRSKRLKKEPPKIVIINDELKKDLDRIKKSIQNERRIRCQE